MIDRLHYQCQEYQSTTFTCAHNTCYNEYHLEHRLQASSHLLYCAAPAAVLPSALVNTRPPALTQN